MHRSRCKNRWAVAYPQAAPQKQMMPSSMRSLRRVPCICSCAPPQVERKFSPVLRNPLSPTALARVCDRDRPARKQSDPCRRRVASGLPRVSQRNRTRWIGAARDSSNSGCWVVVGNPAHCAGELGLDIGLRRRRVEIESRLQLARYAKKISVGHLECLHGLQPQ